MTEVVVKPEMCGKIIDESHFHFHVTAKAKVIKAINKLRGGADFLKALSTMNFSVDQRWLANSCKDPNVRVLLGILEDYKKFEHRPTRSKILIPLIQYAIAIYASDLFYRERGEWFMYQLIKRAPQMRFAGCFINPDNWYPKKRNLVMDKDGGVVIDYMKDENRPDAPPIEQEYMTWYGIDVVNGNLDDIHPDLVKRIVAENRKWMEERGLSFERP